ncbi:hypothetical protein [Treponema pedis]|uniref:hypothetical protein n=1 Tax=Treponema pedis TaxID=409322 RepID=UPI000418AD2C|nr:hypothetical protein [Treponema pedis]
MKKQFPILLCILLFFSCGIDDIIYLVSPTVIHDPSSHVDGEQKYFEFETSDKKNTEDALGYFKGFDIFYRIYENEADCVSAINSAYSYNDSNPSAAANYLLSSLSFSFLRSSVSSPNPLISSATADRKVSFRLTDYSTHKAEILINGINFGNVLRANNKSFSSILRTDPDVKTSNSSSSDLYVAVFTAAYGTDKYFKPFYSGIVKLGYVRIDKPY